MFKILKKEELSDLVILFEIEAKDIAKKAKAGNFFTLRIHEQGERIPLTIADFDREKERSLLFSKRLARQPITLEH